MKPNRRVDHGMQNTINAAARLGLALAAWSYPSLGRRKQKSKYTRKKGKRK